MVNKSTDIAVSVQGMSKRFKMYATPLQKLKELAHPLRKQYHQEFWALRDLSFDIPRGSTFGILGQNGSGKSTLLQVMTGIMGPTTGSARINGRVSALLELGAGFNREFTGRENVFMQGALMGIDKKEMARRFGEIAAFADIGDFIDQPAKTYSSGMYIRLAFACAINVDPEVLIIDEALSVGDDMFQRRCFRRIEEFRKQGKTVVFVSHALSTVTAICDRAMLLDKGRLVEIGETKDVVNSYSKLLAEREEAYARRLRGEGKKEEDERIEAPRKTSTGEYRFGAGGAEILDLKIISSSGESVTVLEKGQSYIFRTTVRFTKDVPEPDIGINIVNLAGLQIYGICPYIGKNPMASVKANTTTVAEFEIVINLNPESYALNVNVAELLPGHRVFLDRRLDIVTFKVIGPLQSYGLVDMNAEIRIHNNGDGI